MPDEPIFVRYQATTRLPIPDIRQSSLTNMDECFHLISFASSLLSQYRLCGFQILLLYGVMTLAEQRSMKRIPGGTRRIAQQYCIVSDCHYSVLRAAECIERRNAGLQYEKHRTHVSRVT
jgi:hypothetical protein